jgi:hypothetical protein
MKEQQTAADYRQHLQDAVNALSLSSASYDRGFLGESKRLAATMRVLVHDTGASKSLLQQMDLKDKIKYYATPSLYGPTNILTQCHLVMIRMGSAPVAYLPVLDDFPPILGWTELSFTDWWNQSVVRDIQHRDITRRDLVLALANRDGGAHVDPQLDSVYAGLSRRNSLSWFIVAGNATVDFPDGPHFACVRQIAHELEKSIQKHLGVTAAAC